MKPNTSMAIAIEGVGRDGQTKGFMPLGNFCGSVERGVIGVIDRVATAGGVA
jgi:hypothetical protein